MSSSAKPADDLATQLAALESVLRSMGDLAVAVSGGVDSLTLAVFAHRALSGRVAMFHAVSPAVPAEGTQRTRELADAEGWRLSIIDAGEFNSSDYMRNPLNRCFYCKTSLYGAVRPHTTAQIVSGTNLDDLGEYRPGLIAAQEHSVRHPFVEAGIAKAGVRAIARYLGLAEVAELPASPCLSSRIETGIAIDPVMLGRVHETERLVERAIKPRTVRCRVRARGVVVELDEPTLTALSQERRESLATEVGALFQSAGFSYAVSFAQYRVGSAFLHNIKVVS
jgi:pyridinium-3,5-biscarboxylic acid mononucleotide sulfurtransferase